MGIFKKILGFEEEKPQQEEFQEKRKLIRYPIRPSFPLQAKIVHKGESFDLQLVDATTFGIGATSVELSELPQDSNDKSTLVLKLEKIEFQLEVKIVRRDENFLGLEISEGVTDQYKKFLQILAPIAIGSTLREYSPEDLNQNSQELLRRLYVGEYDACLTLWYKKDSPSDIEEFEFSLEEYAIRGKGKNTTPEVYCFKDGDRGVKKHHQSAILKKVDDPEMEKEVKKLFTLIIQNLNANLPSEVTNLLKVQELSF